MSEHVIRRKITPGKFIILILVLPAALALFTETAFAGERRDRPAGQIAGAVSECNSEMAGEWVCTNMNRQRERLNLSLHTDANGVTRLVKRWGGVFCGGPCHHSQETFVADGKFRHSEINRPYAASCNHRTKPSGYKIFRIAMRLDAYGKIYINEYIVRKDGVLLFGSFRNGTRMDGHDVVNSYRPSRPDYWEICVRDDGRELPTQSRD